LEGIGAGFPEFVDPDGWLSSREVLEWTTQPALLLADIAPTTVDSDVRCAALGEGALGAAQGLRSYAYVIVGTGLSYALVEDGQARPGARGEAIALGELEVSRSVDPGTELSLERYASGEGIRERFVTATGRDAHGAADVFASADAGDPAAGRIVSTAAVAVGAALRTLVRIVDPGAIVVGGGVTSAGDRWRAAVESAYAARAGSRPSSPPLSWGSLGSRAGIIGAAIGHRSRQTRASTSSTP
jgi:glucokinase